jgi:hypothetical protein
MRRCVFSALFFAATSAVSAAEPFQIIVTVSPPGSLTNPANWQPTQRIRLSDTGGTTSPLPDIPTTQVFDPAGIAFRTANDLFVGNRHGNALGLGSISRFTLSADGSTTTSAGNFTVPGMIGVHELAYNTRTDELFAATVNDGIFRFRFDAAGNPVPNGSFARGRRFRGVVAHPNGRFLHATAASGVIYRFALDTGPTPTELPSISLPGASNLHFFCLSTDGRHAYVGDINASRVYRLRLGSEGELTLDQTVNSPAAIDLTFSPDGDEMFVGNHFQGGITRYLYNRSADTWTQSGFIPTSSMGSFGTYNAPPCLADFNRDGFLDFFDFDDFVLAFEAGELNADFSGDGFVDFFDFDEYVRQFEYGC